MKAMVKSISLDNSRVMMEFVSKQTNFSKSVKFLILDYCNKNGIQNISDYYSNLLNDIILQQTAQKDSKNSEELNDVGNETICIKKTKKVAVGEMSDDVPACYL